jgi:hypothetical protein
VYISVTLKANGVSGNNSEVAVRAYLPKIISVPSPDLDLTCDHADSNEVLVISSPIADKRITVCRYAFRELHILICASLVVAPVESIRRGRSTRGTGARLNDNATCCAINASPSGASWWRMRLKGCVGCLGEVVSKCHLK